MNITRPPRTDVHRQRDAYLQQFADLGLQPIVSTNGSIPHADIQFVKGPQPGEGIDCWVTTRGRYRLVETAPIVCQRCGVGLRVADAQEAPLVAAGRPVARFHCADVVACKARA